MTDEEIIHAIGDIYLSSKYSDDVPRPKEEWSKLFHTITGNYIIWSHGLTGALRQAYGRDREALRKSLIPLLQHYNRDFKNKIDLYPELAQEYNANITANKECITKLEKLW